MPYFLHGEWEAFSIEKGCVSLHKYAVYITHNTQNIIAVQEDGSCYSTPWRNMGISNGDFAIGTTFTIDWEDRCDSKGTGVKQSHHYKLEIKDNDLIVQKNTNGESSYSFGNWVRRKESESIDEMKKRILEAFEFN